MRNFPITMLNPKHMARVQEKGLLEVIEETSTKQSE
jgi:hypothetical protein